MRRGGQRNRRRSNWCSGFACTFGSEPGEPPPGKDTDKDKCECLAKDACDDPVSKFKD